MANRFSDWLTPRSLTVPKALPGGVCGVGCVGDDKKSSLSAVQLGSRPQTPKQTPATASCLERAIQTPQTARASGGVCLTEPVELQDFCGSPPGPTPQTLQTPPGEVAGDRYDAFEERAALLEFGAGVPREWAEGYGRMVTRPRPLVVDEKRWRLHMDDCRLFLDQWAAKAAAQGWTTLDIFGAHSHKPAARYDLAGAAWLIGGATVVLVTGDSIVVERPSGARLTIRRRAASLHGVAVPSWEL